MTKADVEFHSDGFRPRRPAVNVKVYGGQREILKAARDLEADGQPGFALWLETWLDENESVYWPFETACEDGREMIQSDAEDIFEKHVKVWFEGRSGGWAVVDGLSDFETWDAIDLGRWAKFSKYAKACAEDVPYQIASLVLLNVFEPMEAQALTGPSFEAVGY